MRRPTIGVVYYHHLCQPPHRDIQRQQSIDLGGYVSAWVADYHRLHFFQAEDGGGVAAWVDAGNDEDFGGREAELGAFSEVRVLWWGSGRNFSIAGKEGRHGGFVGHLLAG